LISTRFSKVQPKRFSSQTRVSDEAEAEFLVIYLDIKKQSYQADLWMGRERRSLCVWNERVLELCLDIKAKTSLGILGKFLTLKIISYAKSFIILSLSAKTYKEQHARINIHSIKSVL
jgi:hypothetical protein